MKKRVGMERNGIRLEIGNVPGRKKPALCVVINGNECYPVALFTTEGRAGWFVEVMEEFLK